ncbi:MAG: DNA-binding domain-containing protein, partial [Chlamydiota bacterium]
MSEYDETVPLALKKTQEWFASIITQPIDDNSQMEPQSPLGVPMTVEAAKYIIPSPTLEPDKRIEIYNQQYWWRLLSTLHDNFPLTTRLFGYHDFNKMVGFPYLQKYQPNHWSLNHLGDLLPKWIREDYHEEDQPLIQDSIDSDWAYVKGFFAKELPFELENEQEMIEQTFYLQPCISLFKFTHRLLPFRDVMIDQEPEYWEKENFPTLEGNSNYFFVIYRDSYYNVCWLEVDEAQFLLLSRFKIGQSVIEICNWLEKQSKEMQS